MRYALTLLVLVALAGCGGPGPAFRGAPVTRVGFGEHMFDIRVKGRRAEAVRVSPGWAPRLAAVGPQAVFAIEQVSGCRVDRLTGDQAMMRATLDCGAGAPEPLFPRPYLECDAFDLDDAVGELICYPF
jgi:hypothetical protein